MKKSQILLLLLPVGLAFFPTSTRAQGNFGEVLNSGTNRTAFVHSHKPAGSPVSTLGEAPSLDTSVARKSHESSLESISADIAEEASNTENTGVGSIFRSADKILFESPVFPFSYTWNLSLSVPHSQGYYEDSSGLDFDNVSVPGKSHVLTETRPSSLFLGVIAPVQVNISSNSLDNTAATKSDSIEEKQNQVVGSSMASHLAGVSSLLNNSVVAPHIAPEPDAIMLVGLGFVAASFALRRRR